MRGVPPRRCDIFTASSVWREGDRLAVVQDTRSTYETFRMALSAWLCADQRRLRVLPLTD
jgi:hypothetical protein